MNRTDPTGMLYEDLVKDWNPNKHGSASYGSGSGSGSTPSWWYSESGVNTGGSTGETSLFTENLHTYWGKTVVVTANKLSPDPIGMSGLFEGMNEFIAKYGDLAGGGAAGIASIVLKSKLNAGQILGLKGLTAHLLNRQLNQFSTSLDRYGLGAPFRAVSSTMDIGTGMGLGRVAVGLAAGGGGAAIVGGFFALGAGGLIGTGINDLFLRPYIFDPLFFNK